MNVLDRAIRKFEKAYDYSFGASEHFVKWYGKKVGMKGVGKWPTTGRESFYLKERKRLEGRRRK